MASVWNASVELMLMGMGTVFVFLTFLVIAMTLMSWCISKIAPAEVITPKQPFTPSAENPSIEQSVAAAAAAAYAAAQK